MGDTTDPTAPGADEPLRRRGLRRRTSFAFGIVVGIVIGAAGAVTLPDLFDSEPDCERPTSVSWEQASDGRVSLEVSYDGDGTDGCDANVVFSEAPQQ